MLDVGAWRQRPRARAPVRRPCGDRWRPSPPSPPSPPTTIAGSGVWCHTRRAAPLPHLRRAAPGPSASSRVPSLLPCLLTAPQSPHPRLKCRRCCYCPHFCVCATGTGYRTSTWRPSSARPVKATHPWRRGLRLHINNLLALHACSTGRGTGPRTCRWWWPRILWRHAVRCTCTTPVQCVTHGCHGCTTNRRHTCTCIGRPSQRRRQRVPIPLPRAPRGQLLPNFQQPKPLLRSGAGSDSATREKVGGAGHGQRGEAAGGGAKVAARATPQPPCAPPTAAPWPPSSAAG